MGSARNVFFSIVALSILACAGRSVAVGGSAAESPSAPPPAPMVPPPKAEHTPLVHPPRQGAPGRLAFHDIRLFDGTRVIEHANLWVENGVIQALGPDVRLPEGAVVVEGAGLTLLPGLMDAHAHPQNEANLRQSIMLGVTTSLIMVGAPSFAARMKAPYVGPRRADVFSAGHGVTVPHGHGTQYGGNVPVLRREQPAAEFVDARVAEGSDFIKILYDHYKPTLTPEQIRAVVVAAGAHKKLAVAHVGRVNEATVAVRAGVDGLVHLWWRGQSNLTEETLALMKERRVFVVPTLQLNYSLCRKSRGRAVLKDAQLAPYITQETRSSLLEEFHFPAVLCRDVLGTVRRLEEHGISVLAGTDAPMEGTGHGASLHEELVLLVEAGLTPAAALAAATSRIADAFGIADRGYLAVGKIADLVLVKGDPTSNIRATREIAGIWKNGIPVDREAFKLKVALEREAMQQAPGSIANFDSGTLTTGFGRSLAPITDRFEGGTSDVKVAFVQPGAKGSAQALSLKGELRRKPGGSTWGGVTFRAGDGPVAVGNSSKFHLLSFWARGAAASYIVSFFSKQGGWDKPMEKEFTVSSEWKEYRFELSEIGVSQAELLGIFWGGNAPGRMNLELDELKLE